MVIEEYQSLFPIHHVGNYPKPDCVKIPTWFDKKKDCYSVDVFTKFSEKTPKAEVNTMLSEGTQEVLEDQIECGFDVVTNGEIERENYIHFHLRHLTGFNFKSAYLSDMRNGNAEAICPKLIGKIKAKNPFLVKIFLEAQKKSIRPVKMTIPGPLTISDSVENEFYVNEKGYTNEMLCIDLASAINVEVLRLAKAGCKNIQIDEPMFLLQVPQFKYFGLRCLNMSFDGVPDHVYTTVHIAECIDQDIYSLYSRMPRKNYIDLAHLLNSSEVNAVSIEDAIHRIPDEFFKILSKKDIVLGCVKVNEESYYTPEKIADRVRHIIELGVDPKRIILSPDTGFGMLDRKVCLRKMKNLSKALDLLLNDFGEEIKRTPVSQNGGGAEIAAESPKKEKPNELEPVPPCNMMCTLS